MLWRSFDRYRFGYAIAAGAILALMFGEGGVYAVTYCGFVIGALALGAAIVRLSITPLLEAALAGSFAAGFAAIKLLPSRDFVSRFPRPIGSGYSTDWHVFAVSLFSFDQDKLRTSPGGFGFHEYGAYVGIGFALLAVCSLLAAPRKTAPWLLASLAILDMSRGENPSGHSRHQSELQSVRAGSRPARASSSPMMDCSRLSFPPVLSNSP